MSTNPPAHAAGASQPSGAASLSQADRAKAVVAAVRQAQPAWAALSVAERVAKLLQAQQNKIGRAHV